MDHLAMANGLHQPKTSNWRQQQVRDQLGHTSSDDSRPTSPPFRLPMTTPVRIAPLRLRFVIVGGSLGGLSVAFALARSGHNVHVVEQRERLVEDACGVRIPPNLARILDRWGLGKDFKEKAILCKQLTFRKLRTGEKLGHLEYKEEVMKVLEADFWLMHYSDLLAQMYSLAISAGAIVQFGTSVTKVNPSKPSVTLSTGEKLFPDLVIGADGYHSICQQAIEAAIIAEGDDPTTRVDSGTVVYSMNADVSDVTLDSDPELYDIIHKPVWTAYAGPNVSVLTSPSRDYTQFSVQIFNPDVPGTIDTWEKIVSIDKINTEGFPRALLELTRRAEHAVETKFVKRKINEWVHPKSKLVLLGESAHPQIPSSTHSGSLAVEDAAVFGALFSRLRSREQIRNFLVAYEDLRKERCWDIQQSESANSASVMLPDGPAQEERDRSMREAAKLGSGGWDESTFRHLWENIRILFAYDPEEDAEEWWQRWGLLREQSKSGFGRGRLVMDTCGERRYESHNDNDSDSDGSVTNPYSMTRAVTVVVESLDSDD
ncbi:FAD/NAD-binding domain-containing protein [Fomitiporia mediterranea MF3/22]|uniref:FAD/NAD-binding domain-containing protein n=1 Tax=Fomitiporia mediterranea (strain MF3/22) TaxID=694068 RepID=UPI0004407594|nr:FAD/NAD-binding domain-containing protein [Fomitiporia mediterranea MF3/22]EJD07850.1 FAD/NAD-binding domain-containing protein [Fomitiporia mediterranea MF3/22]